MDWAFLWTLVLAAGIPSAIVGILISRLTKKIDKRDKEREDKENARLTNQLMLIDLANASLSLGEATAEAVQRIPEANCNGDMHAALNYAKETRQKYIQFQAEQTLKAIK